MTMVWQSLADMDEKLLRAHAAGDLGAMIDLYGRAGDAAFAAGDIDAACFYTTHAYVFALQDGHADAAGLHAKLVRHGRES